jgi:hypothetical protein
MSISRITKRTLAARLGIPVSPYKRWEYTDREIEEKLKNSPIVQAIYDLAVELLESYCEAKVKEAEFKDICPHGFSFISVTVPSWEVIRLREFEMKQERAYALWDTLNRLLGENILRKTLDWAAQKFSDINNSPYGWNYHYRSKLSGDPLESAVIFDLLLQGHNAAYMLQQRKRKQEERDRKSKKSVEIH